MSIKKQDMAKRMGMSRKGAIKKIRRNRVLVDDLLQHKDDSTLVNERNKYEKSISRNDFLTLVDHGFIAPTEKEIIIYRINKGVDYKVEKQYAIRASIHKEL